MNKAFFPLLLLVFLIIGISGSIIYFTFSEIDPIEVTVIENEIKNPSTRNSSRDQLPLVKEAHSKKQRSSAKKHYQGLKPRFKKSNKFEGYIDQRLENYHTGPEQKNYQLGKLKLQLIDGETQQPLKKASLKLSRYEAFYWVEPVCYDYSPVKTNAKGFVVISYPLFVNYNLSIESENYATRSLSFKMLEKKEVLKIFLYKGGALEIQLRNFPEGDLEHIDFSISNEEGFLLSRSSSPHRFSWNKTKQTFNVYDLPLGKVSFMLKSKKYECDQFNIHLLVEHARIKRVSLLLRKSKSINLKVDNEAGDHNNKIRVFLYSGTGPGYEFISSSKDRFIEPYLEPVDKNTWKVYPLVDLFGISLFNPAAECILLVSKEGYVSQSIKIEDKKKDYLVSFKKANVLKVIVKDEKGRLIVNATIRNAQITKGQLLSPLSYQSDVNGECVLKGFELNKLYRITAHKKLYLSKIVSVNAEDIKRGAVEITLKEAPLIIGKVYYKNQLVANASVSMRFVKFTSSFYVPEAHKTTSDVTGEFSFVDMKPGNYQLEIQHSDYGVYNKTIIVKEGVNQIDLELKSTPTSTLVFLDENNKKLSNTKIEISLIEDKLFDPFVDFPLADTVANRLTKVTDSKGQVEVKNMSIGIYRILFLDHPGYITMPFNLPIGVGLSGEKNYVEGVYLKPGCQQKITVITKLKKEIILVNKNNELYTGRAFYSVHPYEKKLLAPESIFANERKPSVELENISYENVNHTKRFKGELKFQKNKFALFSETKFSKFVKIYYANKGINLTRKDFDLNPKFMIKIKVPGFSSTMLGPFASIHEMPNLSRVILKKGKPKTIILRDKLTKKTLPYILVDCIEIESYFNDALFTGTITCLQFLESQSTDKNGEVRFANLPNKAHIRCSLDGYKSIHLSLPSDSNKPFVVELVSKE